MVLGFCRFEFGEGGAEGCGIDNDSSNLNALLGGTKARVRFVDAFFQGVVLALLDVGELSASSEMQEMRLVPFSALSSAAAPDAATCLLAAPCFPLEVVCEEHGVAAAVEAENGVGDAIEQIAVVRDEDQGAGEFEQRFLQNLKRGDIEVVGGLVEDEHVGGLKHEAGDEDAGALAAAEALDRLIELLAGEQKARSVAGDVNDAILIDDRVGVGRERAAKGE